MEIELKAFTHTALGAIALGVVSLGTAAPAHAATCWYAAYDLQTHLFVEGGRALKMSNACDRARRQCNRQLERWAKRGKVGRGAVCARM